MIVSLFHGSTWRNPHVNETVFISQHFLQPSIIISGLWLIRENVGECLFQENHCGPAPLNVPIYSTELVAISIAFNAQKHLQMSHSFMVNQHNEITFTFSKILHTVPWQSVKYSKSFRRATVDISSRRGDFWNSYFLLIWQFHNSNCSYL